ncbi:beta-lactamase family protein [Bacillus sp. BGMRC 2118]|nr:beta-lactamase family protein [Bacillus sp. BGMRC 2118]
MINIKELELMIKESMENAYVPGLAIAITKGNETVYEAGFGVTSIEDNGIAITPNTLFCIGSLTKPLTGTLLMRLVEENLLELDLPIVNYIPWFQLANKEYSQRVTLRMLLSHTAGLPHIFEKYGDLDSGALKRLVQNLSEETFIFEPGFTWSYSDLGIDIAGYLAEVVTGRSYQELMIEYVFSPLGMSRSTFEPLVAMTYPLALAHQTTDNGTLEVIHKFVGNAAQNPSSFAMTTVHDVTRFMKMIAQGGRNKDERYLTSQTIADMHTVIGDYFTLEKSGYGLTFEIDHYNNVKKVWHDGSIQSYASWLFIAPEHELGVVIMTNKSQGLWEAAEEIINYVFDQVASSNKNEKSKVVEYNGSHLDVVKAVGTYIGSWLGVVRIVEEEGNLVLNVNGENKKLKPFGFDRFYGEEVTVGFVEKDCQVITSMVNGIPCEKIAENPHYLYHVQDYTPYLGSFNEGNDLLRFYVEDDRLMCFDQYDNKSYACTIVGPTRIVIPNCLIDFIPSDSNEYNSIRINKGKILNKIKKTILDRSLKI